MSKDDRRDYRSGSVYQRKSDGRWIGAVLLPERPDGIRPRRTVSATTEPLCKRKVRELIEDLAREGVALGATATTITVQQWGIPYLALIKKKLRPKTYANDAVSVTKWIIPTIGKKKLAQLSPADVRAVENAIMTAVDPKTKKPLNLSTSTALRTHNVLLKMLKAAVVEGHPVPQRIFSVGAPTKAVSDRDAIPTDQALRLLAKARELPDGARWVTALLQGMRQGECLGLTWAALDLDNGTADISWQLQAIPYEHGCTKQKPCGKRYGGDCPDRTHRTPDGFEMRELDGRYCLVRPKTAKGQRIIPLVPWMIDELKKWKAIAPANPHGLVWPQPDGRPTRDDDDRAAWLQLQTAADVAHSTGRKYHLHEARHTTATLLLEAGVDPEVIKGILGHSDIVTSRQYQHVSQNLARKAMSDVAAKLNLHAATTEPAPAEIEAALS